MKENKNEIWVGSEQLSNPEAFQKVTQEEFVQLPIVDQLSEPKAVEVETNRRDFLKYLGFGLGAATLAAGCDIPVKRAIPYVVKPDEIVPGVAAYYASSYVQGGDYCSILVKTREGRPIKIEGNSLSGVTKGGTSARAQAAVLSLYDTSRFSGPSTIEGGQAVKGSWDDINKAIAGNLRAGAQIRIVSNTILSPTTKQILGVFQAKFPNTKVVTYDPVSSSAILEANRETFGDAVIPAYHFDKAEVIVSFDADFLGTWISPVEFAAQYAANRRIDNVKKAKMSRHVQVESHMSMTGSNADNRILVKPSEQGAAIVALYNEVAAATGGSRVNGPKLEAEKASKIAKVAKELLSHKGKSLVVSGSNNLGEQILINAINNQLGNYGKTLSFDNASLQRQGIDKDIRTLVREMNSGSVDVIMVMDGANPAYDLPDSDKFVAGMAKVKTKVSFSGTPSETTMLCDFVVPTHHFLESWGDAEPKRGMLSLIQPTIAPLFDTKEAGETLLLWAGAPDLDTQAEQPYLAYLKKRWENDYFASSGFISFQSFWDTCLHDGVYEPKLTTAVPTPAGGGDYAEAPVGGFQADLRAAAGKVRKPASSELEISFYETVNIGAGQFANNPWLMEMPDPVNRCAWGNYLAIPVYYEGGNEFTSFKGLNPRELYGEADLVDVEVGGKSNRVAVIRQFGQNDGTVALALGYGRKVTGTMGRALGDEVGADVYPWLSIDDNGNTQYYSTGVTVSDKVGEEEHFACVQYHHTMGVTDVDENGEEYNVDEKTVMRLGEGYQGGLTKRSVIFQNSLSELDELVHDIEHFREHAEDFNSNTLYPYEEYKENYYSQGHHWGMHIDMNACIGCGACQVACIAENNVPVVGKKEVSRHHEMTWIRIDRYFYGDYENPSVVYQPMMCQHCDNAPCENVCPVAATNHSSEGLNQMTYNRCIGTRYCANNCPYKVRRFNWMDYTTADIFAANEPTVNGEEVPFGADNLTRMVLNPDVTVRSRGVIEKCSFCVQRIQEGKLLAKRESRPLRESDVKSACMTACPTGAIVFGDQNDKNSTLAKRMRSPLNYLALEEINTRSSVGYGAKVNNRSEELDA